MITFPSNRVQLGIGQEATLRIRFNAPTTMNQALSISVTTPGLVSVPANIQVPVDVLGQDITLTGEAEGQTELTLRYGSFSAAIPVDISAAATDLVINEVNFDMAGTENEEFVEVYNPTLAQVDLAEWSIELVNGSNGQPYKTISLASGMSIPPNGYLIVGDVAVRAALPANVVFIDIESSGNDHDIQMDRTMASD